ncbi:MAG: diguanylate cyclase [Candidatus Lindowbacteria bacterium]|nr:diguanylate cyclase [Candidatus Lindowbacteria bacterium]
MTKSTPNPYPSTDSGPRSTATIMIVDDDQDMRNILSTRLDGVGYTVIQAIDGKEAINLARDTEIDVALLDVKMPEMNGFDVLARLMASETPPIVIFCSAVDSLGDKLKALYGGASDYIQKPFEPQELLARIACAVRHKKQLDEARAESRVDPLTLLSNRRSFEKSLFAEVTRAAKFRRCLSMIILHVDGLTDLNDMYGVATGDDCLKAIARAMRFVCEDTDRPSRITGNEFAVIIPEADEEISEALIARIQAAISEEQFSARGRPMTPVVSMGYALFPIDAQDAKSLEHAAYQARRRRA